MTLAQLDARYRLPLMSFFRRRVDAAAEVEDLTQEVLFRIVKYAERPNVELADGLIFLVAANLLKDRARRIRTDRTGARASLDAAGDFDRAGGLVEELEPERVLLARERLNRVLDALRALPPRTREAFLLYRFEGLRQREIAKVMGTSVSAVEKQVASALHRLAEALD
jgi:RNA polymerase sigma-70 factor (ECF subfamily)